MNFEELSKLIDFIFEDESNFLLISTDLSHFYTQEEANKLDNICLNAIAKEIYLYLIKVVRLVEN